YLTKLINENDHINYQFYTDPRYTSQSGTTTFRTGQNPHYTYHRHVAVPFWVAIETMTLGEVIRLLHYLEPSILEKVMKDFGMPLFYRNEFLNMFDIIKSLRNFCAHGSLVYRYQSPKYIKLNANLVTSFNLTPSETGAPSSVLSLFDALQIVNYFESTRPLKKHINSIIYRNNKHFKSSDFDLNSRLLTRMGNPNLKEWKKFIFTESQHRF
ncbi:TPA: Abi family protein, partial [Streptococcus suis]